MRQASHKSLSWRDDDDSLLTEKGTPRSRICQLGRGASRLTWRSCRNYCGVGVLIPEVLCLGQKFDKFHLLLCSDECKSFSHSGDWAMWTIFQVLVLIAAGGIIIFGGEIDGHAVGVAAFLGVAAGVAWLASSLVFSQLTELTRLMYRRRREVGGLSLSTLQYFRDRLRPLAQNVGALVNRTMSGVAIRLRGFGL
jgi:hypothetical protein